METTSKTLYRLLTEVFILLDDADRRALRLHNLSIRQFNILYHLDQEQGLSINELSHHLFCDPSLYPPFFEAFPDQNPAI